MFSGHHHKTMLFGALHPTGSTSQGKQFFVPLWWFLLLHSSHLSAVSLSNEAGVLTSWTFLNGYLSSLILDLLTLEDLRFCGMTRVHTAPWNPGKPLQINLPLENSWKYLQKAKLPLNFADFLLIFSRREISFCFHFFFFSWDLVLREIRLRPQWT